jgi:hypothetical protein
VRNLPPYTATRLEIVRVPSGVAREISRNRVVAGEACTELGLDPGQDAQAARTDRWPRAHAPRPALKRMVNDGA